MKLLRKILRQQSFKSKAQVLLYDVFDVIPYLEKNNVKVDIVFVTPPYPLIEKSSYRDKLLILFSLLCSKQIVQQEGLIMLQHRKTDFEMPQEAIYLELFDTRTYGDTQCSFFKNTMK